MNTLLDIVGSTVIGGLIILMIVSFNQRTQNFATETLRNNLNQYHLISSTEVIENDFYKIGFMRDDEDVFTIAKENEIMFFSDIDNDYSIDSLYYVYNKNSLILSTPNPNDHPLIRKVNNSAAETVAKLTNFSINYLDSSGTKIPFTNLLIKEKRRKIKFIEISLRCESDEPIEGKYESAEWLKLFSPKNL